MTKPRFLYKVSIFLLSIFLVKTIKTTDLENEENGTGKCIHKHEKDENDIEEDKEFHFVPHIFPSPRFQNQYIVMINGVLVLVL